MKISLNWLKEYVDLPQGLTAQQLSQDLTLRTVEVEDARELAAAYENVVVGKIVAIAPHPQADKLQVCQVQVGWPEPATIVCGGSNIYVGMKAAVALPGASVRWHGEGEPVVLKATKLRGVSSQGMICAAAELDLEELFEAQDEHEVMDLKDFDVQAGQALAVALGLEDIILEIDNKSLTNRPDLWGHYGIARELSAMYQSPLKPLPSFEVPGQVPAFPVQIEQADRCRRYAGLVYEGLSNGPSPFAMQSMLWRTGVRPISLLVDLTNYVMLAVGQPCHGFDRHAIQEGITVREAHPGEELLLLDGQKLQLDPRDLMICDAKGPVALAGIMGGKLDSLSPDSTQMILEIANFEPIGLRKTASRFHLRTESSVRNEKGLDSHRVDQAMALADALIRQYCKGAVLSAYSDQYPQKTPEPKVELSLDWLDKRLGKRLTAEDIARYLQPLGFHLEGQGRQVSVQVPSWRGTGDVSLPDDLLEEIARMIGYNSFEFIPPSVKLSSAISQQGPSLERRLREYLAFSAGLQEIYTYPWVDRAYLEAAGLSQADCLMLASPPSPETASIRTSLVPGMLEALQANLRYYDAFKIFEVASVFSTDFGQMNADREALPLQGRQLVCAFLGKDPRKLFREAKGVLEALPQAVMSEGLTFAQQEQPAYADPKAWLNVFTGDVLLGSLCLLSKKTMHLAGIKHSAAALIALNVEGLVPLKSRNNHYQKLPMFPLVEQDFSILLDEGIGWNQVQAALGSGLKSMEFIEEYRGKQVQDGKKSLTFRVTFGLDEGTMSSQQVEERVNIIMKRIQKLGGEVRN